MPPGEAPPLEVIEPKLTLEFLVGLLGAVAPLTVEIPFDSRLSCQLLDTEQMP